MALDLDITYIVVLLLFVAPLLALNALVFRPFGRLFEARHEQLEGAVVRAQKLVRESEAKASRFEERIRAATAQGIEARTKIRNAAQAQMTDQVENARQRLNAEVETHTASLERRRREALADVHVEAQRLARLATAKLLGREI